MSGMVDRSGVADPQAGSAPADQSQKEHGAPGRIQELLGQKKVLQGHIASQAAELAQMKEDVAYLKGRDSAPHGNQVEDDNLNAWGKLSDGQLAEAFQAETERGNPQGAWQAAEELAERKSQRASERVGNDLRNEYEQKQALQTRTQDIYARINNDFGVDVTNLDHSSPLVQASKQFASKYSQEQLDQSPELVYAAISQADNHLNPGRNKRLTELEGQVAQFKEQASQPSRGPNFVKQGTAPPPESSEFLKAGNVKSAIRSLTSVRSFDE